MKDDVHSSIVRIALSLGAAEVGGSLSDAERELVDGIGADAGPTAFEIEAVRSAIRAGDDPLGEMLYEFRDANERRGSGTVYTPSSIVKPMVGWVIGRSPVRVVDAGCGSGRYTGEILRQDPKVAVVAIDLDPLATLMTRAVVAVLAPEGRVQVIQGDFTRAKLPEVSGATAFIGNPPYLRHHQIPSKTKTWAQLAAASMGLKVSGLAGLHALFFLATGLLGRAGDVGCYVTSSEWLDVNYGAIVRDLLTHNLGGENVHVLAPEVEAFEGTQTTATISTFTIGRNVESIGFRPVNSLDELGELKSPTNPVARDRLMEVGRWSTFIRTRSIIPSGYIELGELMRVHRGTVTGANAVWVTSDGSGLPDSVLVPSVTKAKELFAAGAELSNDDRLKRVIDLPIEFEGAFEGAELRRIKRFLTEARRRDVHKGYIARTRKAWWSVGMRTPAPILATYMARRPPAFVVNSVRASHINIAHGLYPRQELPSEAIRSIASVLGSTATLSQGRTYSGGLTKFEPREMERLPIPDLATLMNHDGRSATMAN